MKTTPFWHEAAPPEVPSGREPPAEVDIAVMGAGFTGLNAAKTLAEAGRDVCVFEKGAPGAGASTRNGGMIGWGHRTSIAKLAKTHGQETAQAMMREARLSLDYTLGLIGTLEGETRHVRVGRYLAAGSPRHFDRLVEFARTEAKALDMEVEIVPRAGPGAHITTDLYHGGLYFPQHGALHPALFHKALLAATREAGAEIADHCEIREIRGAPGDWQVHHALGMTRARELIYAANGYTGGGSGPFRGFARRLMPIPSYIIATEPLGANRVKALLPQGNNIVETRSQHSYFRPDPDGERILYGGRSSLNVIDEDVSARRLRDIMLSVFPDLEDVALTHSWRGFVAFTFDGAPHIGQQQGIWHACGYNGSGVAMAPYLGWRLAQKVLGTDQGTTGFDPAPFNAQPLYGGNPWFLRGVELWMKAKDRMQGVRPIRRR
ncbi:MAG: FAD-binding oxidoreductase [Pseudomonadota bacterium]